MSFPELNAGIAQKAREFHLKGKLKWDQNGIDNHGLDK